MGRLVSKTHFDVIISIPLFIIDRNIIIKKTGKAKLKIESAHLVLFVT